MLATAAVLVLTLVSACGGSARQMTRATPGVQIESLNTDQGNVGLRLLVANRNDVPMHVHHLRLRMTVDGAELFSTEWSPDLDLGARGREQLDLETAALLAGLERLDGLITDDRLSLPYRLEGEMRFDRNRTEPIELRGFLHPVPGQPGRFR